MEKNAMIKSLIEMANSFEDADRIIEEYTPCKGVGEKLAFLYGMFNVSIIGPFDGTTDLSVRQQADYEAVLTSIVNKKWR